jgi:hypothetical protein
VGYNNSKNSDDTSTTSKSNNFIVNPAIGKAIGKNTILGIDLSYSHAESKTKNGWPEKGKADSYGAGIFLRQYFPIISRLYVFSHIRAGVSFGKEKNHYVDYVSDYVTDNKNWGARIDFYPGVSFAVNRKLQLESGFNNLLGIQYSHSKTKTTLSTGKTSSYKSDQFLAGASLNNSSTFFIGFRLLLNNKG